MSKFGRKLERKEQQALRKVVSPSLREDAQQLAQAYGDGRLHEELPPALAHLGKLADTLEIFATPLLPRTPSLSLQARVSLMNVACLCWNLGLARLRGNTEAIASNEEQLEKYLGMLDEPLRSAERKLIDTLVEARTAQFAEDPRLVLGCDVKAQPGGTFSLQVASVVIPARAG